MRGILGVFLVVGEKFVKDSAVPSTPDDVKELCQRARSACEEARRLADDYRFIISWRRMQPRYRVRPFPMMDANG